MESNSVVSDLIRRCYAAYETNDRSAIESILSDDFIFSSPLDDHIDRAAYFKRCWPNSENIKIFSDRQALEKGNEAFVAMKDSIRRRQMALHRFFRLKETDQGVEVYFAALPEYLLKK